MSCSLSLLAKKNDRMWDGIENHVRAAETYADLPTASKMSVSANGSNIQKHPGGLNVMILPSEKVGTRNGSLNDISQLAKAIRSRKANGDEMIPGAILALGASMACVLSAVVALIIIRGPQTESRKRLLEEISDYHRLLSDDEYAERLNESTTSSSETDEDDEIKAAETV
ncbi:hypothetical protein FGB62_82g065 [Gracilaria domingensis]|nr:hypothetical protein FGB62_82g065 [Gracilaria domingensis]